MFCTKCGNQVSDTARFCTKCGNVLSPLPNQNANPSVDEARKMTEEKLLEAERKVKEAEEARLAKEAEEAAKKKYSELEKALNNMQNRQKKCPHCGTLVLNNSQFCKNCGKSI